MDVPRVVPGVDQNAALALLLFQLVVHHLQEQRHHGLLGDVPFMDFEGDDFLNIVQDVIDDTVDAFIEAANDDNGAGIRQRQVDAITLIDTVIERIQQHHEQEHIVEDVSIVPRRGYGDDRGDWDMGEDMVGGRTKRCTVRSKRVKKNKTRKGGKRHRK
jgi:hypothetical protein